MRNRLFAFLTLAAIGITSSASAQTGSVLVPTVQTGFLIGPIGGINLVAYSTDPFPVLNSEKSCFTALNGSDIAPWGGLTFEYPLGNANELQNFIIVEALYDSKSSKFTSQSGSSQTTPTKKNGIEADGSVTTALDAQLNYLLINLAYKYNFTPGPSPVGPGIQVGPSIGIRMTSTLNKTVTVTASSGNQPPADKSATATVTSPSAVPNASGLRIALRAGVTYDIPFTQEWIATPTVGYDFPITKVNADYNWRASAVFAGIAFRYFVRG
jgi:hypothetical protein